MFNTLKIKITNLTVKLIAKVVSYIAMRKMRNAIKSVKGYTATQDRKILRYGSGPWTDEQDFMFWVDSYTNLPCMVIRHPSLGHLCGYVGIEKTNSLFGKHYDEISRLINYDAHGGLTFGGDFRFNRTVNIMISDMPDKYREIVKAFWWVGFDCAHSGDLVPGMILPAVLKREDTYRDFAFVIDECTTLAAEIGVYNKIPLIAKINRLIKDEIKGKIKVKVNKND